MMLGDYDFVKSASLLINPDAEERQKEWYEKVEDQICSVCPSMTYTQRLIGCAICILLGSLISLGSLSRLTQLVLGNPVPFAVMYSIGNILSISSTCFLFGPLAQAKSMCALTRIITTSVYFSFMFITLFLAFYPYYIPVRMLWLVIAVLCQFLALVWYNLSFIPYAREFILSGLRSATKSFLPLYCTNCCDEDQSRSRTVRQSSFFG